MKRIICFIVLFMFLLNINLMVSAKTYSDDTGLSYKVSSKKWNERELSKDREVIKTKFISKSKPSQIFMYGYSDMYAAMQDSSVYSYSRDEINMSIFDRSDVEDMYEGLADFENFEMKNDVEYNTIKYYVCYYEQTRAEYGVSIKLKIESYITVYNGYMYMFQYSWVNSKDKESFAAFKKVLKSVNIENYKYEDESNTTSGFDSEIITSYLDNNRNDSIESELGTYVIMAILGIIAIVVIRSIVKKIVNYENNKTKEIYKQMNELSLENKEDTNFSQQNNYCKYCGAELIYKETFCHNCGKRRKGDENE